MSENICFYAQAGGNKRCMEAGGNKVGALGKSKDSERSNDFASNIDVDIQKLLERAGMPELSSSRLFSQPAQGGTLNANLDSIKLRIRRTESMYERTVIVSATVNGQEQDIEATRNYESDYMPIQITEEMLKSGKSSIECVIYSKDSSKGVGC